MIKIILLMTSVVNGLISREFLRTNTGIKIKYKEPTTETKVEFLKRIECCMEQIDENLMILKYDSIVLFNRPNSSTKLILESPHEGKDGTLDVSLELINNIDFKWFILNRAHPLSIQKIGTQHSKSDMAHTTNNLFIVFQRRYLEDNHVIQIHGMKGTPNFQILGVNIYNNQFTTKYCSIGIAFATVCYNEFDEKIRRKFSFGAKDLFDFRQPGNNVHNSNTQGRDINKNFDTGKFLHLELGFQLMKNNAKKIAKVIELASKEYEKCRNKI